MKLKTFLFLFSLLFIFCSCNKENDDQEKGTAKTVLMYLIGDNSLEDDMYNNIQDVEEGLTAANLPEGNIYIYYDGRGFYNVDKITTPLLLKYEIDSNGKASARKVVKTYDEQNSCDPSVMTGIIKYVAELSPSNSYGIIFGSHAGGWLPTNFTTNTRWFGEDSSDSSNSRMEISTLATALTNSGIHFDYILMDACLMSQVEVAYELRNTADYLILSPAEIMAYGFPYKNMISDLLSTGDKEDNAISMATKYINYYKTYSVPWATIAVIKSSEMENLANATRDMVSQYKSNLSIFTTSKLTEMQSSCNYARTSMANSSYDFMAFAKILTGNSVSTAFQNALDNAVIYKDYVNTYNLSGVNIDKDCYSGIGCYIPYPSYTSWNNYYASLSWNKIVKIIE